MLQALKDYAEKQHLMVLPGFAAKEIRWAVDCSPDGRFLAVLPLGEGKNPETFPACPSMTDSQLKTGGEIRSQVLWESAKVALDWTDEEERKERDARKHGFFLAMLDSAGASVPEFGTVVQVLRSHSENIIKALKENRAKPTDKVTFAVSGKIPLRDTGWHLWWAQWFREHCMAEDTDAQEGMLCLMTGALVTPAMTHVKVTKLPDTGSFGGVLVGFDKDAFTSFGLQQGRNAAMSQEMASLYPKALDHLLANASRSWGPVRVVLWFKQALPEAKAALDWLDQGAEDGQAEQMDARSKARTFLRAVEAGQAPDLGNNEYYCLLVSGAASRVVVRSWEVGRPEALVHAIEKWFSDLRIARREGGGVAPDPKFFAVVGGANDEQADFLARNILQFWGCATQERAIPYELMAKALKRFRSSISKDESALHAGIGLLKAFHIRKDKGGVHMKEHLNPEHPERAYQCGRLLAVLAALQYSALGDVGAGVIQRFYGSASQSPRTVFGALIRNSQHHLSKLDGGLSHWYQEKIAKIMARLGDEFPSTLSLEQQSLFALGYYQQMASDRAPRTDKQTEAQTQEVTQ